LTLFQLALRGLFLIIGITVIQQISDNSPVLDVVNVPKEFQDQGYTSEVVARRINDGIKKIDKLEKDFISHQKSLELPSDSSISDLQIPTTNVSLKTVTLFVRQLLQLAPKQITVDLTLIRASERTDPKNGAAEIPIGEPNPHLKVVVYSSVGEGDVSTTEIPSRNPEDALPVLTQDVMAHTEPFILGLYVLGEKGPADSERYFQKATELDRTNFDAYIYWGLALYMQGKAADALSKCEKALQLHKWWAAALTSFDSKWGDSLPPNGKFAAYKKTPELMRNQAEFHYYWGNVLYAKGYDIEGCWHYETAAKLDPTLEVAYKHKATAAVAYANWSICLNSIGQHSDAEAKLNLAEKLSGWAPNR